MALDRMLHPRAGHSDKVSALSDLEYRVWTQYMLSADDFGLMALEGLKLQADNRALAERPLKVVQKSLEALVACGLLLEYRDGGRRYVCDPVWQKYQHISYAKQSINPPPPTETMERCHILTRELFRQCWGNPSTKFLVKLVEGSGEIPGIVQEDSRSIPASRDRLTANGKRLTATANGWREGFDRFWAAYPRKVAKAAAWKAWEKLKPSGELLTTILTAVDEQRGSRQWQRDNGQYIPHPASWLNQGRWSDEPMSRSTDLSETARHNIAAAEEATRLIEEAERGRSPER